MTEGYAELAGTRLYYEDVGSGHPVVLVHGLSLDMRMWEPQMDALSEKFRVIRYDVRGFGRSDLPGSESYTEYDDLKNLLDFLGIEGCTLVGLSMGGAISQAFALTYPEYVESLVLVDAAIPGADFGEVRRELGRIATIAKESGVEAAKAEWLAHPLFGSASDRPEVVAELHKIVGDYTGWHWISDPRKGIETVDRLGEIQAPALVIVGDRDLPLFVEFAEKLASDIPDSRLVVLEGAGHMSNMEAPREFNKVVLSFLGEQHREG